MAKSIWNRKRLATLIAIHDYAVKRLHASRSALTNETMISFWKSVKMRIEPHTTRFDRENAKINNPYIVNI